MSKQKANFDIVIFGAGTVGLATALALRARGYAVAVADRGLPAQESSWAGGGILSPLYPWRYSAAMTHLAEYGQHYYKAKQQIWFERSGVDAQWRETGLWSSTDRDSDIAIEWARQHGYAISQRAPFGVALTAEWVGLPTVAQLRPPKLGGQLSQLCKQEGVAQYYQQGELNLSYSAGQFDLVSKTGRVASAPNAVVCAGAWSSQVLAGFNVDLDVRPVRGQIVMFRAPNVHVENVVLHRHRYLIPRSKGRILIGSTLEDVGFDKSTTQAARADLVAAAAELVPALADATVEQHWAGLRPGSPKDTPWVGAVGGVDGLFVNTGHYRNGIVLAPGSAELLAQLLAGESPFVDPAEFSPPGVI